jgi:acyl carrier protein
MEKKFIDNLKDALEIEDRKLLMTDNFREYPEWDSLAFLSVIAMLDEEYGVQIENAEFKNLKTVGDIYAAVNKK